jgi:hypothetical protein
MNQARAMTVLRQESLHGTDDGGANGAVRRGEVVAFILRGAIALVTLAIVVLSAQIASG